VYALPQDVNTLKTLMRMTFHYIDVVGNLQLSKTGQDKSKKIRLAAETKAWKAQAAKRQEVRRSIDSMRLPLLWWWWWWLLLRGV
jgi:hypothetical protein